MKLTVVVKLQLTERQADALLETLERANGAANYISDYVWHERVFRQYDLHKRLYYSVKERFGLSAQVVVRVIAKVADAYKLNRKGKRTFKKHGAIAFDERILAWRKTQAEVSIWTTQGREHIKYVCDERSRSLLADQHGETDLVHRDGQWFLYTTCNVEEPPLGEPKGWLGVDAGIVNIATDSEGKVYSGAHLNSLRHRHRRLRQRLQAKGTKGAWRLLQKRRRKERRFATHTNHCISKSIVATAKALNYGIAMENLSGIRERVTARRSQRATLHSWAFYQLRAFVEYKAKREGVCVCTVDPRNTSRTCPACGCIDKANRPSQSSFLCKSCGFAGPADYIAARNISGRAAVNQPCCSPPLQLARLETRQKVGGQSLAH